MSGGATGIDGTTATGGTKGGSGTMGTGGTSANVGPLVKASVTVSGADPKPVSPLFFGQNYWSWVPSWGDAVAGTETKMKDLKLRLLRAGGANNDKQDPVAFSLDEIDDFVAYARGIGAEPLLQVPVIKNIAGTAATAQDAADLVTYVNVTKGYGIKYFSIGNEPDLYVDQKLMPSGYDADAFCTTFSAFASAMRAVDPSIQLVGPDLSWKYQSGSNDWLTPFLQSCGSVTDVVAVHRYPFDSTACTDKAAYADAATYRQTLSHLRDILQATGQSSKPLAITEANITWDGDPSNPTIAASPGTFPAGLWVADNLGVSLEAQLHSVSYWSLSEGYTLGFFDGTSPRPALYMLELFSNQFGTEALTVTGAPTSVSIYAGRDATNARSTLFVVNKTNSPLELTVNLTELARSAPATLNVLPLSLEVASLPDDGGAAVVTDYASTMKVPTAR
jgi:hypothetical protein